MGDKEIDGVLRTHFEVIVEDSCHDHVLGIDQADVSRSYVEGLYDGVDPGGDPRSETSVVFSCKNRAGDGDEGGKPHVYVSLKAMASVLVVVSLESSLDGEVEGSYEDDVSHNSVEPVHVLPNTEDVASGSNLEKSHEAPTDIQEDSMPEEK
jgi:hypothetical protein